MREESAISCRKTNQSAVPGRAVQVYRFLERVCVEETLTYITMAPTYISPAVADERINVKEQ